MPTDPLPPPLKNTNEASLGAPTIFTCRKQN